MYRQDDWLIGGLVILSVATAAALLLCKLFLGDSAIIWTLIFAPLWVPLLAFILFRIFD